ncbi:MAG TPA: lipase maturation factor family protein [Pseudomonadota bacterium]|nr:lipase maturation factor family protein [Pseudomonadota bacterium]
MLQALAPPPPAPSSEGQPGSWPEGTLSQWLFLRGLGLSFLLAFASLWPQLLGLVGARGLLPAAPYLRAVSQQVGAERFYLLPTLFWLGASDNALQLVGTLGLLCALLLTLGIGEGLALFGAWLCYLSLVSVGRDFMSFQWDSLLLETALWSLPLVLHRPGLRPTLRPPVAVGRWLLTWLLLRFMFAAGWAKLASQDPVWRDLSALDYHFFTQPLPTPLAYYAHQLPTGLKKLATATMFFIELAVPFLLLRGWIVRRWAALALIGLQVLIAATGNYGFFNFLSAVLVFPLLPDAWIRRLLPDRLWAYLQPQSDGSDLPLASDDPPPAPAPAPNRRGAQVAMAVRGLWFVLLVPLSLVQAALMFLPEERMPETALRALEYSSAIHAVNRYGLFAVMTRERPEIVLEGSVDGVTWLPYEFKYKPGALDRRPRYSAPHQPRLDWQMWFAALRPYRRGGWLDALCIRLLQGSPDVRWLLDSERDPFFGRKPQQVRATRYRYEFTSLAEKQATGAYYKRRDPEPYLGPVELPSR